MSKNVFFKQKGPFAIGEIFKNIVLGSKKKNITDIKTLDDASSSEITFLDSVRYIKIAKSTKAGYCITTDKLKIYLPKTCKLILVKNVLFELCQVVRKFYPDADIDTPDISLKKPKKAKYPKVRFGNNVFVGKNCKIGKNTVIGSNSIIEHDIVIGENCTIGSQVVLKNSIIGKNVVIQDGSKIGLKGFGFIPLKEKNLRFPHIGKVILKDNSEIGSNCTIDRGSIGDTIIGKNTFLDNQVHVAHNVKFGDNCMVAGQVGFAGSSTLGNNVSIGGQAGISGHLNIGDNVKIGGGSGVVNDITERTVVMGYPAVPLKEFLKISKKK
jgi:UDP-3-O-[3-hydroxymyristoyl] glucosamine N-acyltransferase